VAKDENGNGLAYQADEKTYSIYQMWLQHRVVFDVAVDNDDPELKIYIGRPGVAWALINDIINTVNDESAIMIETLGRAVRSTQVVGGMNDEAPEGLLTQIDGLSVQAFVYSMLPLLLADIYVPKA
jgi:hypothetical protein